jgi:hypothetical protein
MKNIRNVKHRTWYEHSLHIRTQLAQAIKTGYDVNTVYTHTRTRTHILQMR